MGRPARSGSGFLPTLQPAAGIWPPASPPPPPPSLAAAAAAARRGRHRPADSVPARSDAAGVPADHGWGMGGPRRTVIKSGEWTLPPTDPLLPAVAGTSRPPAIWVASLVRARCSLMVLTRSWMRVGMLRKA